ncbi:MAG: LuxR C-terminal-related transcriptional regulator [Chloroflexota bacterium]
MQDLLRTKLFIPQAPTGTIPRPNLIVRLNRGLAGKLSLVVAPAGYGKTTLVTTWLHQVPDVQVLWLSLDEADNDVRRFFTYFAAALCQLDPSFESIVDGLLSETQGELPLTSIVTRLLNHLVSYGKPALLVLDDYHEIEEPLIHEALSFWLDNQPPHFHLAITSRSEPPLPLPRMRVRREITEIATEDLRFSHAESSDFLNQHMQLNLSESDINHLDSVTEGWVASLQLAALSLQGKEDPAEFIQSFQGDNRYVVDYLVHEVLDKQPGYIRDFLLQTSILGRLNVQLCNAVTEQVGSQQILEALDRARLFVIPLDDKRHWYRYHHLFADCLRAELQRTMPEDIHIYHERASRWFSDNDFIEEAAHHAFAAGNNRMVGDLIGANMRAVLALQGDARQLWQWLQRLPEDEVQRSPQLLIASAWLQMELFWARGSHLDELLADASALIHGASAAYAAAESANMNTEIAMAEANLERLRGNLPQAIEHNLHGLELAQTATNPMLKIGARGSLAILYYMAGNIEQFLQQDPTSPEPTVQGEPAHYARYVFSSFLIDAFRLNGKLHQAERVFQRFEPSLPQQPNVGSAQLLISWAEVLRARNQLAEAVDYLVSAIEALKSLKSMAVVVQTGSITLARIYLAQGKNQEAFALLRDTRQDFHIDNAYYPAARLSAAEAHLHLQQQNLPAAQAWAAASGLHAEDDLTYLLEIDYLVLARILIADGNVHEAQTLLEKLEKAAVDGGRKARLIEVHILQALTHHALDEPEQAVNQLGKAIDLAYLEGFVRIFVDEGKSLVPLLKQIGRGGVAVSFIQQLLPLFEENPRDDLSITATGSSGAAQPVVTDTPERTQPPPLDLLIEPLTDREVDTLRYLTGDLTVPQIAEQMIVAPSTVRSYIKSLYSKLDAHSRMEAVNRARILGLIT